MAYVHCHACDWSQDDFYSLKGYNPPRYLESWNKHLCGDRLDEQFTDDAGLVKENGPITRREVLAREYEKFAKQIREMKWVTEEAFQKACVGDEWPPCPKCGKQELDID